MAIVSHARVGAPNNLTVEISFANTPGAYKIGVIYNLNHAWYSVTTTVVVVAVKISAPDNGPTFQHGNPADDRYDRVFDSSGARIPLKRATSGKLTWSANVMLLAPSGYATAVSQIHVGFVQHATWVQYYGYYGTYTGRNKYMVSPLQDFFGPPRWAIDYGMHIYLNLGQVPKITGSQFPYYDAAKSATFFNATGNTGGNSATITAFDNPQLGIPFDRLGVLVNKDTWKNLDYVTYMRYLVNFNLDIVASTLQGGQSATSEYWVESRAPWNYDGSGTMNVDYTVPFENNQWLWEGMPYSGIHAPAAWPGNPVSPLQEIIGNPNQQNANWLLNNWDFYSPDQPF